MITGGSAWRKACLLYGCLVWFATKKSAGMSYGEPLHGELFFCNQTCVDQFVSDSMPSKELPAVRICSTCSV